MIKLFILEIIIGAINETTIAMIAIKPINIVRMLAIVEIPLFKQILEW